MKTVAITKEHINTLLLESNNNLNTLGLDNVYKERKRYYEVSVINEKVWFITKMRYKVDELKNIKKLSSKEYKLQNKQCS
jgi:hypothetical protein